jgi:hypothetical protein
MSGVQAPAGAKSVEIQAVVIRADGTREDLGTVAYWNKNPLRRVWWGVKRWLRVFKTVGWRI